MTTGGGPAPTWEMCEQPGCAGARVADSHRCLAHATREERGRALAGGQPGSRLDGRGCVIDGELLAAVVAALPRFRAASFDRSTFAGNVDLSGAEFPCPVSFDRAEFCGSVDLAGAR